MEKVTVSEVISMVVTWWLVACLRSAIYCMAESVYSKSKEQL